MAKQFTLGTTERLKSRKGIEQLFSEGKRFVQTPFKIHYTVVPGETLKFGVAVSRKNFKKAVDRNRIKRLTREAFRLQKLSLKNKLAEKKMGMNLFFIYTARELPEFAVVSEKVTVIINKIIKLVDENTASNS